MTFFWYEAKRLRSGSKPRFGIPTKTLRFGPSQIVLATTGCLTTARSQTTGALRHNQPFHPTSHGSLRSPCAAGERQR